MRWADPPVAGLGGLGLGWAPRGRDGITKHYRRCFVGGWGSGGPDRGRPPADPRPPHEPQEPRRPKAGNLGHIGRRPPPEAVPPGSPAGWVGMEAIIHLVYDLEATPASRVHRRALARLLNDIATLQGGLPL